MGYQQNNGKKNYNNNRTGGYKTQRTDDRPRNKTFTFPLTVSGVTGNDRTYDVNEALSTLETLNDNDIFTTLSVPVHISRALLENDETRRGTMNIGFIKAISVAELTADVTIFGKNVATIEDMDLNFVPRVLVKDEKVVTFLGFDLVRSIAE